MRKNNFVVIITLNYNQSKMTLECVDSVLKSSYKNIKLFVIDNGSSKDDYQYLIDNCSKEVDVKRIDDNCGYVGGINYGLVEGEKLNPEYFLIMNNDTVIDEFAVQYLVETGDKYNQQAIVSGKVYHFDRKNILQYVGGVFENKKYLRMKNLHVNEKDVGQCDVEMKRDMLDDIFWLLPSLIVKKTGKYSENFFLYGEQADYALQAVKNGFKLIYTPKAKLWHKGSLTTGGGNRFSPVVNFWRKKSAIIYLYRNTERRYFIISSFKLFSKFLIKNILNLLGLRKTTDSHSEYAGLIGILNGFRWVVFKKPDNGFNPFL